MMRLLPGLLLAAALPSCVMIVAETDVRRADGSGYEYVARRDRDEITRLEVRSLPAGHNSPGILAVTATVFADRNGNGLPEEDEVIHRAQTGFDRPARSVEWEDIRVDEAEALRVRFEVRGRDREVVYTMAVPPEDLGDFDLD